jgi:hypothetical protein
MYYTVYLLFAHLVYSASVGENKKEFDNQGGQYNCEKKLPCYLVFSRKNITLLPCVFQREYYPDTVCFPERILPCYHVLSRDNTILIPCIFQREILPCYHILSRENITVLSCNFQREYHPDSIYFPEIILPLSQSY